MNDLEKKYVCKSCIDDIYVINKINERGRISKCSYCMKKGYTISIHRIAKFLQENFLSYYEARSLPNDEYDEKSGDSVNDILMNELSIEPDLAEDLRLILEELFSDRERGEMGLESEFSEYTHYAKKNVDDEAWREKWDRLEKSLQTENRFINEEYVSFFNKLTEDSSEFKKLIVTYRKGSIKCIYRARMFSSEREVTDALITLTFHLGLRQVQKQVQGE